MAWAGDNVEADEREKFREVAESELLGLHEGNCARYQQTPDGRKGISESRLGDVDGVGLETEKWIEVLGSRICQSGSVSVSSIAYQCERGPEKRMSIGEDVLLGSRVDTICGVYQLRTGQSHKADVDAFTRLTAAVGRL